MVDNDIKGELRVYRTPAEEGGSAKAFMVRDGLICRVEDARRVTIVHPALTAPGGDELALE